MSLNDLLLLFLLFTIKHFVVDFPLQGEFQWKNKGTYGHLGGILHALLHTVATFIILIFFVNIWWSFLFSILDGLIHYHIDFLKMKTNQITGWRADKDPQFWWLLGLDQFLHYLTYILIVFLVSKVI